MSAVLLSLNRCLNKLPLLELEILVTKDLRRYVVLSGFKDLYFPQRLLFEQRRYLCTDCLSDLSCLLL